MLLFFLVGASVSSLGRSALNQRSVFLKTTAQASNIRDQIEAAKEGAQHPWLWAANEANHGSLVAALQSLRAQCSPFHHEFLSQDPAKLRRVKGEEFLMSELRNFLDPKTMQGAMVELATIIDRINARHRSTMKQESKAKRTKTASSF